MRKLLLLIPVLAFALLANATSTTISAGTPNDNNIRAAINGSADTIYLNPGEYIQENQIHFKRSAVLMAANKNDKPIIKLKYYIDLTGENTKVFVDGLIFDGTASGQQAVCVYDANTGKELHFNDCEFKNFAKATIYNSSNTYPLDSCVITNCYFHDNKKSALYFPQSSVDGVQTCYGLIVKNSTFANYDVNESAEHYASVINLETYDYSNVVSTDVKVLVDHCIFYNYLTYNTDHCAVRVRRAEDVTVSNCIFAHPEPYERRSTYLYGGSANIVTNCLSYNLTKSTDTYTHASGPTITNCAIANPLFNDLANNKYTYEGDWVTPSISPARGAATDGSDLGDPRWYSDEVLPSTDFASPYQLTGDKAKLTGNVAIDASNYLQFSNSSDATKHGVAIWKVRATRSCYLQATLNIDADNTSGHRYQIEVFDSNNTLIGTAIGESANSWDKGDKVISDLITLSEAGDYKIKLSNLCDNSTNLLHSITLSYVGGTVVTIPAEELDGAKAVLVDNGHKKVYKLANGDLQYDDNGTPLGEYVYWNINATKRGNMKVTLNVVAPTEGSASTHDFLVELYSDLSGSPIASSAEAAATSGTGAKVLPDAINIPATGSYIIKLTNRTQYSSAILHSIEFEYLGGATITVPAEALIGEEAVLVDGGHLKVSKLANGDLKYGDNGYPLEEYVYWNINATKYGRMNVTANVVFDTEKDAEHQSSHQFLVELYSDLSGSPIASSAEDEATSATGAITMPAFNIPATGNYIIKLTNQKQWSSAILHSIEFAYAGGEVADVPGQIVGVDAMLLKEEGGTLKMYINDDGDIQYGNNGYNLTEYAVWNINATEAGEMIVTLNIAHNGHLFTVELYDGTTLLGSAVEADATKWDEGDIDLDDHLTIPAAGSYTIKLINRQQYSTGAIHGITFTKYVPATAITMSDTDTNTDAWSAYVGGAAVNVTLNRTILGGMLNAICLPFALNGSQVKAAFGNDVQWYYLNEASLENEVLDLQFAAADDIYQGTPYLIKTSSDVVNPTFNGVSIVLDEASASYHSGWPISFQGTFVQTTIDADGQNMLIYSNNQVGFPDSDKTLKGFRAYFRLTSASLAPSIKTARIITPNNTPTIIDLVNGQQSSAQSQKLLIDGRLIIVRDGVQYNVIGARVK